ncbi:MAG: hypothetical protein HYX76_08550 [Acidobacteria bacterium]|nr:hypothetical protein [Acidobacteriota bacterium]
MTPILLRPVREQLEHDRIIRQLQAKYRRRYQAVTNIGDEQNAPIRIGANTHFPDLVLTSPERGRRLLGVVEVETGESVNHLEAMSQWATFARLRGTFALYVPAQSVEIARRLCTDLNIPVSEIWSFHPIGDQIRFTLVHRAAVAPEPAPRRPSSVPRRPAATAARRKPARAAGKRVSRNAKRRTTGVRSQKRK